MSKERLLPVVHLEGEEHEFAPFVLMRNKFARLRNNLHEFSVKALAIGRNDPRKIIYAIKMGSALAFVSLLIFWKKPFAAVSKFSIWAILTVIVMFEFSVGATCIKGFNRGLGTFCAGMLAFLFAGLSLLAGSHERVVIVISFFITGSCASYLRFYPSMEPYDYGFRVFTLTYCILMVAGNRTREYAVAILTRLLLIGVGGCICFLINTCIYPIWAGDDLHRLVVKNFDVLANSLEECVEGYLKYDDSVRASARNLGHHLPSDQLYLGYKSVIESAGREKNLLGFAEWEPPHGRYRSVKNPWKVFVKLSNSVRHCAYSVMALHGCILSEIQAPPEKRHVFHDQLQRVAEEGADVLRILGIKIESMEKLGTDKNILKQVHEAAELLQKKIDQQSFLFVNSEDWEIPGESKKLEDLPTEIECDSVQLGIKSLSETAIHTNLSFLQEPRLPAKDFSKQNLRKIVPCPSSKSLESAGLIKEVEVKTYHSASSLSLATFASLLIEFVARLQNVVDCFEELSEQAGFVDPDLVVLTPLESAGFCSRLAKCFRFKN